MVRNFPIALIGALLGVLLMAGTASASEKPSNSEPNIFVAQVYGSICETPYEVCVLEYEDLVGSPCECPDGSYGSVVEY